MLKRFLLLSPFLLSGCAAIATVGGGGISTIQTAQTIDMVSTGASAASTVTTGKSLTDHAISYIVGKDCRMLNVLNKKKFCRIHKFYEPNKGTSDENRNGLQTIYITEQIITEPIKKIKPIKDKLRKRHGKPIRTIKKK